MNELKLRLQNAIKVLLGDPIVEIVYVVKDLTMIVSIHSTMTDALRARRDYHLPREPDNGTVIEERVVR